MAYDLELAERVRALLVPLPVVRETKMFGGLAFMINEKMTVFANTTGGLWLRCAPERDEELHRIGAEPIEMKKGRNPGPGWLSVAGELVASDAALSFWVDAAVDYNLSVTQPR